MEKYLVGGIVRDRLLGIANDKVEKDWLVVGSSIEEMLGLGYRQVGKSFPVFLHPDTREEYALARVERKVGVGYKGFEFDTSKTVTLEQDLSRRDLTINAMAEKDGILFDPFNGRQDLDNGLLRHISIAFSEDPVRILRVARFAAKFKSLGFKVAHPTHRLMCQMVESGEVDALTPERVFKELDKALSYTTPSAFFKVLCACGAYPKVFPSIKNMGLRKTHTNEFEFLDNLGVDKAQIKFAIWLSDESENAIKKLSQWIKCPKDYQQLALLTSRWKVFVSIFTQHRAQAVLAFFNKTDAFRRKRRFSDLLQAFRLLGIDVESVVVVQNQLSHIKTADLEKTDIVSAIYNERIRVIKLFLNATK